MMANIVKTFAGNKYVEKPASAPQRVMQEPDDEYEARAIAGMNRMREENVYLRAERARLQAELNVQLMRTRDLEDERLVLRTDLEAYRRYSVEVQTHLQTLIDVARRANEAALIAGEAKSLDKRTQDVLEETERDVREIASKFAPDPQA